ncbi:isoquinoline 1-oxidoreductase beta subunit [Bradyrhizobium sp. USDA 4353]
MNRMIRDLSSASSDVRPLNPSRRGFLGAAAGALVLGFDLPGSKVVAQGAAPVAKAPNVSAFLEIRADSAILLRSPFIEGGQGISTAMAQIVGEELDADPATFVVECAPPGSDYLLVNGARFTGGSFSVRSSYATMRRVGASARQMLLQAAAARLRVPVASLTTEPGRVRHTASNRSLPYGELAADAAKLPVPETVALRAENDFRWIGKPFARLDARDKSTGKVSYGIDLKVDGMLQAAVQHAPRRGLEPGAFANEAEVKAMTGVHSIHRLPGAVAVVAERWWYARRAVETLKVAWTEPAAGAPGVVPANFSSEGRKAQLAATPGPGFNAEAVGDATSALGSAARVVTASYDAPYLVHGQLEPPSAIARWNADGTLDLWLPNQAPEMFQAAAAKAAGVTPDKIKLHSPPLGGFFGRHFVYPPANPFPQVIQLAKAVGRPVKVIWSREEEFFADAMRPLGFARFKGGLDKDGIPIAIEAEAVGDGPLARWFGRKPETADSSAVEGIADKPYAIPHRRVAHVLVEDPNVLGFWRSVGHSMNDFFYETFFDELRRCRPAGSLSAAAALARRQAASQDAARGGRRSLRRLEARALHRRGRQQAGARRGDGLAVRQRGRDHRRGVAEGWRGARARRLGRDRSRPHRQSGDHRRAGQFGGCARAVVGAAGGDRVRRRHAPGAQLRCLSDPAAGPHAARARPHRRERRPDGRHRRARPAGRAAGGRQRGRGSDGTAHPQPAAVEGQVRRGGRAYLKHPCFHAAGALPLPVLHGERVGVRGSRTVGVSGATDS